jgi:hypothetical protein
MYKTEVEFSKVFNNVFYPEIEKGTEDDFGSERICPGQKCIWYKLQRDDA